MSDKLAMMAVDKMFVNLLLPVEVVIKHEKRAKAAEMSRAAEMIAQLSDIVKNDPWTLEDEERAHEIITRNIKKREELKNKKGIN